MFKEYNTNQVISPLDLEITIPKNDIVFVINDFIESIPEDAFDAFRHERGANAYHPRMMLKLILYAYSQAAFSDHKAVFGCTGWRRLRAELPHDQLFSH